MFWYKPGIFGGYQVITVESKFKSTIEAHAINSSDNRLKNLFWKSYFSKFSINFTFGQDFDDFSVFPWFASIFLTFSDSAAIFVKWYKSQPPEKVFPAPKRIATFESHSWKAKNFFNLNHLRTVRVQTCSTDSAPVRERERLVSIILFNLNYKL